MDHMHRYLELRQQALAIPAAAKAAGRNELTDDEEQRLAAILAEAKSVGDQIQGRRGRRFASDRRAGSRRRLPGNRKGGSRDAETA